ncbi:sensor histidine kinase [Paractinoplanes ovalisporus]|uniref:sensor histidine kinase n=1 Tax=Paractinoplanes ovalisporus TaxID=2810368 RepID=UPI0027DE0F29|nr:histidine kinase [Actinoplanes ovalisporus]
MSAPPEPDPFLRHPVGRWLLGRRDQMRRLDQRRPWLFDVGPAVLIFLFSLPQVLTGGPDHDAPPQPVALRLAAAVVLLAPLWWRRRAPLVAFTAVAVIMLAYWFAGLWISTAMVMLIVLYGVAARSSMRVLVWVAVATAAEFTFGLLVLAPLGDFRFTVWLLVLGTCSAAIAVGLAARTSRAYLAALGDRAAWLETDRERQARLAVAEERTRVAREMHDIVGHHVSIIIGLADGGATMAANRQEKAAEPLRLIGETGRQALDELRRVLGVLRAEAAQAQLNPQPGLADVERMLAGVRTAGLSVSYETRGDLPSLSQGLQLAVYRIVQEALTNTLKHAGRGASAEVAVTVGGNEVNVRVTDRSPAGRPAPSSGGQGIVGIRERAGLYGGVVTAGPDGEGWTVDVVMTTGRAS